MSVAEPRNTFRAVLFDAGQTLLRVEPYVGHVYAQVASRHGVHADPEALEAAFRRLWKEQRSNFPDNRGYRTSEEEERVWWHGMVDGVFRSAGRRDDFDDRFEAFFEEVFEVFAHPPAWHVFEDVRPALDALESRGIRRGVVSNWDHRLYALLGRLGLRERFEFVLTSAEVGYRKPHPEIFRRALERLGLPPERVVYVGDSYDDDVVGAQAVGIVPLLLDRRHAESRPDCLARLTDLSAWLS